MSLLTRRVFLAICTGFGVTIIYQTVDKQVTIDAPKRWTYLLNYISRHMSKAEKLAICNNQRMKQIKNKPRSLQESIILDYERGEIVNVNGWVLTNTEICASHLAETTSQ